MTLLEKVFLVFLAIFLILTGIFAVTNLQMEWGPTILGFAALAAGACCVLRLIKQP